MVAEELARNGVWTLCGTWPGRWVLVMGVELGGIQLVLMPYAGSSQQISHRQ